MPLQRIPEAQLRQARELIAAAERVLVFTGSGVSAESGVPTFRGEHGLWRSFRPEELATPEAFARDPKLVWEWYGWRRSTLRSCRPNPGHLALARWMASRSGVTLVTQNVDGLHEAAARAVAPPSSARGGGAAPIKLHGSILVDRCSRCAYRREIGGAESAPPPCPECGALLRPDVVWFGEPLPEREWSRAIAAASRAEVALVVGTSALVYPAAGVVYHAAARGASIVVVDPDATAVDRHAHILLRGPAGAVLPDLLR